MSDDSDDDAGGQIEPERPLLGVVGQSVAVADGVQEVGGRLT